MSIILKGIDLPEKENQMYMMELYADGHCSVAKIEDGKCYELTIPSETEAIQIPKGHGRLIDVSRLYPSTIDKLEYGGSDGRQLLRRRVQVYTEKDIEYAPTILEAEE